MNDMVVISIVDARVEVVEEDYLVVVDMVDVKVVVRRNIS